MARATGLERVELDRTGRELIHEGKRVSFWWTMGVNQSYEGARTAQSLINLALMTGNIGRPGTGANSITGQCNAMGSRLFSNTTNLLGGHDFENPDHRAKIAAHPRHRRGSHPRPEQLGLPRNHRGHLGGKISGLWVDRDQPGPLVDQPEPAATTSSAGSTFSSCRTCTRPPRRRERADLVLPAAGWGEKEGTFINSERRIGLRQKGGRAPGRHWPTFPSSSSSPSYWGCGEMFRELGLARSRFSDSQGALARASHATSRASPTTA